MLLLPWKVPSKRGGRPWCRRYMEDRWVWFRGKIWSRGCGTASRTSRPVPSKLPRSWSNSDSGRTRSSIVSWIFTKPSRLSCFTPYQRCIGQLVSSTSWDWPWEYKSLIKVSLRIVKNWSVPSEGLKRCCRYLLAVCKISFRGGEGMFLFFRTLFETPLFLYADSGIG